MLRTIHIQNVALIEEQTIEFSDGFSVLTGETGAGKSIIIESLNFVLGERASKELIKYGTQKASVEAIFTLRKDERAYALLREQELLSETEDLVLYRELSAAGKNICRVNGTLVSTAILKEIGDLLVDIHGQHAHQSLLNPKQHLLLLDEYGGAEMGSVKQALGEAYRAFTKAKTELHASQMDERERVQKCDLYAYQLKEIAEANLTDGEEESLQEDRKKLQNAHAIMEALDECCESLSGDAGALALLSGAMHRLDAVSDFSADYAEAGEHLHDGYYAIEDVSYTLRNLRDGFTFEPEQLDQIEWRLETISQLKRKYGASIGEILTYAVRTEKEYQKLLTVEERKEQLQATYDTALAAYQKLALRLSVLRQDSAKRLSAALLPQMTDLGMPHAAFEVRMDRLEGEAPSATGFDDVEFLLSANRGEPLKPLSRVASGGEISRIMLAFKTVLAGADQIPTMVFDEIDSGISGQIGTAVAQKMRQIAKDRQVLCVTHLPQIAAYAHTQYLVKKETLGEHTKSYAVRLSEQERAQEIARIMGSGAGDAVALAHAQQLIDAAKLNVS